MSETKTFAQSRLKKLQESFRAETRKHKPINPASSLKGVQQPGDDSNRRTCFKRDTKSKALFSPSKVNHQRVSCSAILKSLNKNGLSSSGAGMECQQTEPSKDVVTISQQSLKNHKSQNLVNKSNMLDKGIKKSNTHKGIHGDINSLPVSSKETALKKLKKAKQSIRNEGAEKCQEILYPAVSKRPSDHENLAKFKIPKIKKNEDSSKNVVDKKYKNEKSNVTDADTFEKKISSIIDSYDDCYSPPAEKQTKYKTEKSYQVKEPVNNIRKSFKYSEICKKEIGTSVKEKETEIKGKGKIKQESSPSKTKVQMRLEKFKAVLKGKMKERKKDSSGADKNFTGNKFDVIQKNDNSHFIESMDWEPSNDVILRSIRDEVDPSEQIMEWQDIGDTDVKICDNSLYLVVDTNVLLRNIDLIKRLSKAIIRGFKIIQVIPWQVLKELDNLKTKVNYENVNISARKAIRFLSEATNNDQFNIVFQSQSKHFEECPFHFIVEVPDDHLIKCCYQLKGKSHKVLLLSNDVNLRVKTKTNNIQAVEDKWISNLLNQESNSRNQSIHCFEKEPKEFENGHADDCTHLFVHKTTEVILSTLYNIVLLKYQEKYGALWPLWVPQEPHLPQLIDFMTSCNCFEQYWTKLNSINEFYMKNKSYDEIKPAEVENLGRKGISLIKAMCIYLFIPNDLALQFFKHLSFLKSFSVVEWNDSSYIEGSYRLAEKYLKDTEDSLNEFVVYIKALYDEKGSLLYRNKDVLHHLELNLELIARFKSAVSQIKSIQEPISEDSEIAKGLHKTICDFLGDRIDLTKFPIFSPEDIVEYVNPNRYIFIQAEEWLFCQESVLAGIKSNLI